MAIARSEGSKIPGLGGRGEDVAAIYLESKGYRILARNYRTKYGEIDIIAKGPQNILVFVEVKTLSGDLDPIRHLLPEDNLSNYKLYKLRRICQFFANAYPVLVGDGGWQIDLIAIVFGPKGRFAKHYRNL